MKPCVVCRRWNVWYNGRPQKYFHTRRSGGRGTACTEEKSLFLGALKAWTILFCNLLNEVTKAKDADVAWWVRGHLHKFWEILVFRYFSSHHWTRQFRSVCIKNWWGGSHNKRYHNFSSRPIIIPCPKWLRDHVYLCIRIYPIDVLYCNCEYPKRKVTIDCFDLRGKPSSP